MSLNGIGSAILETGQHANGIDADLFDGVAAFHDAYLLGAVAAGIGVAAALFVRRTTSGEAQAPRVDVSP